MLRQEARGNLPGGPIGAGDILQAIPTAGRRQPQHPLDDAGDLHEADGAVEEGLDGHLIGGIEDRRRKATFPKRLVIMLSEHGPVTGRWQMHNGRPETSADWEYPLDDPDPNSFSKASASSPPP